MFNEWFVIKRKVGSNVAEIRKIGSKEKKIVFIKELDINDLFYLLNETGKGENKKKCKAGI